jgi:hypothetical protein
MATIESNITVSSANTNAIPINFKEVWGTNTKTYYVNPEWSTRRLFEYIYPQVQLDFGTSNFELVLTGQDVRVAEMAPALAINDNINLKNDILGPEMRLISFYIRKLNYQYPEMANLN